MRDIDEYILSHYKKMTNAQMALELGVNKSTISNHRKKLGISWSDLNSKLRSNTEYICSQYRKKTKKVLAKELNCSVAFIQKIWTENGLSGTQKTKYTCNENYFSEIDKPEKAYWLGFIAADGNIYRREGHQGQLQISIKDKDVELLIFLKKEIESDHPIKHQQDARRTQTIMATITIVSDILVNNLLDIGIGIRKTFDLDVEQIFRNIPFEYHNSFILGYFDGDGSIGISTEPLISKSYVNIASPISSLQVFSNHLKSIYIPNSILQDKRNYTEPFGRLQFTNTTGKYCFLKYIYSDNIQSLTRKKERALELIKRIENNITNRSGNKNALEHYKSVVVKREELLGTPNE